ncbi:hypothetical protein FD723_32795 (plasmid) [Nostoc sp. C052]|uniref:Uncharacterized protein n=2 Tax=Nostoc TaxID=1177 RepID=A0ABR8ILH3_9NOSO|nr:MULTISPECIES: hypothetical protein [Nostoc]MBD2566076.1 hypothetical protein [Nostoc linckia FACHB-391]MBD2651677.1 hypothetical protein [Nostoc foliaceum FACHB-393]QLE45119.1 hypothetical protein FD723_32795 [Nostoc sp. C052]
MSNTEKLHYDYGSEFEEGEESSWLWIAEMKEPALPEPHCYSLLLSARGTRAAELIKNFQSLSPDEAQEYARKLAFG